MKRNQRRLKSRDHEGWTFDYMVLPMYAASLMLGPICAVANHIKKTNEFAEELESRASNNEITNKTENYKNVDYSLK